MAVLPQIVGAWFVLVLGFDVIRRSADDVTERFLGLVTRNNIFLRGLEGYRGFDVGGLRLRPVIRDLLAHGLFGLLVGFVGLACGRKLLPGLLDRVAVW